MGTDYGDMKIQEKNEIKEEIKDSIRKKSRLKWRNFLVPKSPREAVTKN